MKFCWNTYETEWEYDEDSRIFFRTMRLDYDEGGGGLIKVHLFPRRTLKGKTDLIFYHGMAGSLHTLLTKSYTEVLVADLDFFAPFIAYFVTKEEQRREELMQKYVT